MEKKLHIVLALVFALFLTTGVSAQDTTEKTETAKVEKQKKKGGKKKKAKARFAKVLKKNIGVELTDDQQKKLVSLIDENLETLDANQKKLDELIGKENKKKLSTAMKTARKDGKTRKEATKIGYEEIGLSEDAQKSVMALNKERRDLMSEMKDEIIAMFSEDQKKEMKASKKKKGNGKKGNGKKGKKKEKDASQ